MLIRLRSTVSLSQGFAGSFTCIYCNPKKRLWRENLQRRTVPAFCEMSLMPWLRIVQILSKAFPHRQRGGPRNYFCMVLYATILRIGSRVRCLHQIARALFWFRTLQARLAAHEFRQRFLGAVQCFILTNKFSVMCRKESQCVDYW